MTKVEIITILIYIVAYAIVFIIQKSQFDKQKSIMEKYEKMFSIINIDEIEKYVNVKEKSLSLQFENREKEIDKIEQQIHSLLRLTEQKLVEVNDLKENKGALDLLLVQTQENVLKRDAIYELVVGLNSKEFDEIYETIIENIKTNDKESAEILELKLLKIRKKYSLEKLDLLK
jgi:hypothetical protein